MLQLATGAVLILHGLVHLGYVAPKPADPRYPFAPQQTWIVSTAHVDVGAARTLFAALAAVVVTAFSIAGIALVAGAGWWQVAAVVGAIASVVELLLGFHTWLVLGIAIDAAIVAGVAAQWPTGLWS